MLTTFNDTRIESIILTCPIANISFSKDCFDSTSVSRTISTVVWSLDLNRLSVTQNGMRAAPKSPKTRKHSDLREADISSSGGRCSCRDPYRMAAVRVRCIKICVPEMVEFFNSRRMTLAFFIASICGCVRAIDIVTTISRSIADYPVLSTPIVLLHGFEGIQSSNSSLPGRIYAPSNVLDNEQKRHPARIISMWPVQAMRLNESLKMMFIQRGASKSEIERALIEFRESRNDPAVVNILVSDVHGSDIDDFRGKFDITIVGEGMSSDSCFINLAEFRVCEHTFSEGEIVSECGEKENRSRFKCPVLPQRYRIAFLGDWGSMGPGLLATVRQVQARAFDSYIFGGDNIYEIGIANPKDAKLDELYVDNFKDVQVPQWVIEGNHDGFGSYLSQLLYSQYRDFWKAPFYYYNQTVNIRGLRICQVFVDTNQWDMSAQTSFLESVLGSDDCQSSDFIMVSGHHPIFSAGGHGDNEFLKSTLFTNLKRYRVDLYICGHDHINSVHRDSGIAFVVAGSASKKTTNSWYSSKSGASETLHDDMDMYGFASLEFTSSGCEVSIMNSETGKSVFQFSISSRKNERKSQPVRADSVPIQGRRPWTRSAIFSTVLCILVAWIGGVFAMDPIAVWIGIKNIR